MTSLAAAACTQPQVDGVEHHERVRAYEIAAYLSAASFPFDIADGPPANPVVSRDLTLNALVQHGVHMMDCDRAFLSLIDNRSQFICAEMTRDQSLVQASPARPLLLGISRIALEWGVCPYTMSVFHGKLDVLPPNPYIVADPSYFYIKDFRKVPSFAVRPYVAGYPKMVSYIEVPLRSLSGHILGSYCVVDDRPRDFLQPGTLEKIREVTSAISSYLDTKRIEVSRTRSVRMMDGLNQFIASEKFIPPLEHENSDASGVPAGPFDLDVFRRSTSFGAEQAPRFEYSSQTEAILSVSNPTPNPSNESTSRTPEHNSTTHTSGNRPSIADPRQQNLPPPARRTSAAYTNDLFERAAKTIGFALDVDGLVFFDTARASTLRSRSRMSSLFSNEGDSEPMAHGNDTTAVVLSEYRSDGQAESQLISKPNQSTIQHLTARYPQGHVFVTDEYGVMDYDAGHHDEDDERAAGGRVSDADEKAILQCVPNPRYAMFLPLWHYQRESCIATCLVWVSDTAKTLDFGDVNSLTAFGNSLMVEILRLEALANAQSKSDFISSISHELRSPLHGIMATTELIQDSIQDASLLSMVDMIESCSSTLLDTFDHLLEFARINGRARNSQSENSLPLSSHPRKATVNLEDLIDDMVEVTSLGHAHSLRMDSGLKEEQQLGLTPRKLIPLHPVLITTHVESNRNWNLPLDTGAWKRIILNILSNALKYTDAGYIEVALRMSGEADGSAQSIIFSVTDTGIGMSPDFLKYHIFTAFMQENNLSPGTGLGLSLVKSIVDSLGGNTSVESRLGEGTCVTITIPIGEGIKTSHDVSERESPTTHSNSQPASISLISVELPQAEVSGNVPFVVASPQALQRSVRNTCLRTFGVGVCEVSAEEVSAADILLLDTLTIPSLDGIEWAQFLSKFFPHSGSMPLFVVIGPTIEGLEQHPGMEKVTYVNSPVTGKKLRAALRIAQSIRDGTSVPDLQGLSSELERTSLHSRASEIASKSAPTNGPSLASEHSTPLQTQAQMPRPPLSRSHSSPNISSRFKRFLLVDDNPINLKLLAAFITRIGQSFSTASDGAEAVELYREAIHEGNPYECIFMDISMPVMDGFTAIAEIRRLEAAMAIRDEPEDGGVNGRSQRQNIKAHIFALTGLGSDEARRAAKESGVDGFLLKPIKFKDITPLL